MISIIQIPHLPSQFEYYVGYGLLPLIQNIFIHFTYPNVPSHLLGRRHSPLHLIINIYLFISHSPMYPHIYLGEDIVLSILSTIYIYSFHIPQCTLTFTKEKTWSSPCNYTSHSQMYFSDLLGRRHDPFPLNSQFYIHVTIPNVLLAYLGEEK